MAYGTGWYYASYVYDDVYWPYAYTYGSGTWYNRAHGHVRPERRRLRSLRRVPVGPPPTIRQPAPTRAARAAYGEYRARAWAEAYNPRTGTTARTAEGSNVYGHWGTHVGGAGRRLGQYGAGQRGGGTTPRPSARRAAAAPSSRAATTTCTSARTARSTVGPTAAAGTGTTAASGAAPRPRASIRAPCRTSTATPTSGPPAPPGRASPRRGGAAAVAGYVGGGGFGGCAAVEEAAVAAAADA